MSKPAKNRRAEELFSTADRAKMLWLVENGYGIDAVMQRYGLSEEAADEYLDAERAARRAKDRAGISWTKGYDAWLQSRIVTLPTETRS